MDIYKEIFLKDLYHLLSILFKSNKVKKLYCLCIPQDFMLQSLLSLKPDIQITHYIPENYRGFNPIEVEGYTITHELSKEILEKHDLFFIHPFSKSFLEENIQKIGIPVLGFVFDSIHEYYSSQYTILSISPKLYIFMKPMPLAIRYLDTFHTQYNFNSSLIVLSKEGNVSTTVTKASDQLLYSIRASNSKFMQSDLIFVKNNTILNDPIVCDTTCREDLRLFVWKGELYGSYTYIKPYIAGVTTYSNITVGKFVIVENTIKLVQEFMPLYGGNLTRKPEKNWTWWEGPSGDLQCVYYFNPLTILSFSSLEKEPVDITDEKDKEMLNVCIRGGSCGIVVEDKVYCFTHTFTENSGYNVGVVILSHSDRPRVLGYNHELIKSSDYWNVIFYLCGAVYNSIEKKWILTGGLQDSKCFSIEINKHEVDKALQ